MIICTKIAIFVRTNVHLDWSTGTIVGFVLPLLVQPTLKGH